MFSSSKPSSKPNKRAQGKAEKSRTSSKYQSAPQVVENNAPDVIFFFAVIELTTNTSDPGQGGAARVPDRWGTYIPPYDNYLAYLDNQYSPQNPVQIYRYKNGTVTNMTGSYEWQRDPVEGSGRIRKAQDASFLTPYKTYTVFRGWRFVPFMWTSVDVTLPGAAACSLGLFSLKFNPFRIPGTHGMPDGVVSQVHYNGLTNYTSGANPSWVPTLVPDIYSNPWSNALPSLGLSGELPVILGLMALSQPPTQSIRPFQERFWSQNRWVAPELDFELASTLDTQPGPDESPRAVLVHVASEDRDFDTVAARLGEFEDNNIIVMES